MQPGPTDTGSNPSDGPAATVAHLAGNAGRFITGATIAVDGGFTA